MGKLASKEGGKYNIFRKKRTRLKVNDTFLFKLKFQVSFQISRAILIKVRFDRYQKIHTYISPRIKKILHREYKSFFHFNRHSETKIHASPTSTTKKVARLFALFSSKRQREKKDGSTNRFVLVAPIRSRSGERGSKRNDLSSKRTRHCTE